MTSGIGVGESPYFVSLFSPCGDLVRLDLLQYADRMYAGFLAGGVVRWNMTPTEMLGTFTDQLRGAPRNLGHS